MKKLFKVVGTLAAIGAAVAGGVALYKKYFASQEDLDDFEDDLEEEFEEDLEPAERGYVHLNNTAETVKETAEKVAEDVREAAENAAEDVKEGASDVAEEVKEAAEDAKEEVSE